MTTAETKKKIDESAFVIVRDKISENVQLVASPSNFQVGLTSSPADLTLNGKLSVSKKVYSISDSNKWSIAVDDHITFAQVSTSYSTDSTPTSGYVSVILPKNPRDGQLVIIKDFSGSSSTYPIRIYAADAGSIDGSSYLTISSNYNVLQLIWHEKNWSSSTLSVTPVSVGGSDTQVQFNDGGSFGGDSGLTYDKTTDSLTIAGDIAVNGGDISTTASTFNLLQSASILNVGTTEATRTINLGTAAAAQTINIGSSTSTSPTTIRAGSSGLSIQAGNSNVVTPNGDISIGTEDTYTTRTIKIGSDVDGTATKLQDIQIGAKNTSGYNRVRICDGASSNGHEVYIVGGAFGATQSSAYSRIDIGTINALSFINVGGINGAGINTAAVKKVTIGSEYDDSFVKIRNGTGCVTMQDQPCFLAYVNTAPQLINNTSLVTVSFNAERFDVGSDFNTSTYTFTAPVTGKYLFNIRLRIDNLDTAATFYYVSLITSNATYQLSAIDPNFSADLNYYWMGGSLVADMDASDTAYVVVRQSGGTSNQSSVADEDTATQVCSYFSGWLLG